MSDIGWSNASNDDRKILYRALWKLRKAKAMSWFDVLIPALGKGDAESDEVENRLARGTLSRTKCTKIYLWLCKEYPEYAREVEAQFFINTPPALSWLALINEHMQRKQVKIKRLTVDNTNLVGLDDGSDDPEAIIKRSEKFCFEIKSPMDGQVVGFQEYKGCLYILPLSKSSNEQHISNGKQWMPNIDGVPQPMSEKTDMGEHGFIFFISDKANIEAALNALPKKGMIAPNLLNEFASQIGKMKNEWHLLKVNVIFED